MTILAPSDPEPVLLSTAVGQIAITREGPLNGTALLCVHGIPGSRRDFRYLAPYLRQTFQVVRLDMPGFGDSPLNAVDTIEGWALTVNAVAAALDLEHYLILGHSFGGGAVLLTARKWPRNVSGIILLASMGHRMHRGYGGIPPTLYHLLYRLSTIPIIRWLIFLMLRQQYTKRGLRPPDAGEDRVIQRQLRLISSVDFAALGDCAARISELALIIHCDDDHLVERSITEELAAIFPRSIIKHFNSGGHHLQKTLAAEIGSIISTCFAPALP
ncbi:alpha/beta fold hydrolase [candidate division CSSED10-310 bacterium]|uniref:Alpha/beta fold hydrolase n=1 Tax=candidate division CSSED10-310 bacterium TaxID=2855610 RepID=A0ABV6YVJ2_UNCC1